MLAKAQASALANAEQINSSPSPTTILKSVNSSGTYMCSTARSNIDNRSPVVIYHSESPATPTINTISTQIPQQHQANNMMQHRSTNNNHHKQFLDENDENQFQYHNVYNNYSQSQHQHQHHQVISETQQEADQHSIELRMNNLGNERQDGE